MCLARQYAEDGAKRPTVTGYQDRFSSHVFSAASLLDLHSDIPRAFVSAHPRRAGYGGADLDYARYLAKWWKEGGAGTNHFPEGVVKSGGGKTRKTVTVSDMEEEGFCDLVVEVSSSFRFVTKLCGL